MTPKDLGGLVIDIEVKQGKGLVPKDRKLESVGQATTSDPFVKVYGGKTFLGKTKVIFKTLDPVWNQQFQLTLGVDETHQLLERSGAVNLEFRIFDFDHGKDHDSMGIVRIPVHCTDSPSTKWYKVIPGKGRFKCTNARGHLEIFAAVSIRKMLSLARGNNKVIEFDSIQVCSTWESRKGEEIDLDTSCVAIDTVGNLSIKNTVYYGNRSNPNQSILHSGDQQGDTHFSQETLTCHLKSVPQSIKALYFILAVATPKKTFKNLKSGKVRVLELNRGIGICDFIPTRFGGYTAMFMMRLARDKNESWVLSIIEDFDLRCRCFGSLIPEIKSYSQDLIPDIAVDPLERMAVLRKEAQIRIHDFSRRKIPKWVAFGLKWDVTEGVNIDLDVSAICLAKDLMPLDIVYFKQLRSKDKSIRHSGDEREGDSMGDDERILISLQNTSSDIHYIGFVINSFSGQELDDVSLASCRLYDPKTNYSIATYTLTDSQELDKYTALIMGCLARDASDSWYLRIISKPAQGRTAHDNVVDLQRYLYHHRPSPPRFAPKSTRILNKMPDYVEHSEKDLVVPASEFTNLDSQRNR
jgi:tellurium resistance protein TerZ